MRRTTSRSLAAGLITILLAGCATTSAPPARKASRAAGGGYVDVGLATQAGAFEAYTRRAAAIDAQFTGPAEIGERLRTAAGYEPKQLEASMIAYAALAALQEPGFVTGVRANRDVARRIAADPRAALDLPSGSAAAARAGAALARRGEALSDAGQRVRKASYSVQHQAWSRARITNGPQRLAAVKQAAGYHADPGDRARVQAAVTESGRRSGASNVAARGVAVAALTVLGQDGTARALMQEPRSAQCLRAAKLNFHQCLAAAGTHYEDIYCLGLHAMADPGQCVVDASRQGPTRTASR